MSNFPGNLIRKTPVTPTGPYQTGTAPGIWTLDEAAYWAKQGLWPTAGNVPVGWIGTLSSPTFGVVARSAAADGSGNIYVCGDGRAGSRDSMQVVKYDPNGTVQWQRHLSNSFDVVGRGIAVSSAGDIHIVGRSQPSSNDIQIAKYNTFGVLQWQRQLDGGGSSDIGYGIAVDGSGNVYICGETNANGSGSSYVSKYNTSGTLQWQRLLYYDGQFARAAGIAVDGSGNVYIGGHYNNTIIAAKYDTSGNLQWQKELNGNVDVAEGVDVDSSGNLYVCGRSNYDSGLSEILLVKYNTSGTLQWQRRLGGSGSNQGYSVAVNTSGDVYVCGDSATSMQIAKYNSSGTIQWQRRISSTTWSNVLGRGIFADSSNKIYVCGFGAGSVNAMLVAKLPDDGSTTGSYTVGGVAISYAASSLTDAAATLNSNDLSMNNDPGSLTSSASALTDAATSLTSSVTLI